MLCGSDRVLILKIRLSVPSMLKSLDFQNPVFVPSIHPLTHRLFLPKHLCHSYIAGADVELWDVDFMDLRIDLSSPTSQTSMALKLNTRHIPIALQETEGRCSTFHEYPHYPQTGIQNTIQHFQRLVINQLLY